MATTSNSTLKGVLAFGALTIGAAMFFVGSADDEGVLSRTASDANGQADSKRGGEQDNERPSATAEKPEGQAAASNQADVVEWDDDALVDTTNGTDPSPESTDPFSARPTDTTINDIDVGDNPLEARESDIPELGGKVPIPSTAQKPS